MAIAIEKCDDVSSDKPANGCEMMGFRVLKRDIAGAKGLRGRSGRTRRKLGFISKGLLG